MTMTTALLLAALTVVQLLAVAWTVASLLQWRRYRREATKNVVPMAKPKMTKACRDWLCYQYEEHLACQRRREWWFRKVIFLRWQPRLWALGLAVEVEPGLHEYAMSICLGPISLGFEVTP